MGDFYTTLANMRVQQPPSAPPPPPKKVNPYQDMIDQVGQKYPAYKPYLTNVVISKGERKEGDDRQVEFYPPWESENPNPGKITIQPLTDLTGNEGLGNTIAGEMLHYIGAVDPKTGKPINEDYFKLKKAVLDARQPWQDKIDRKAYEDAKKNGETRSFEDWLWQSRGDEYIMGYMTPDAADEWRKGGWYKDPKMAQAMESIKKFLTGAK